MFRDIAEKIQPVYSSTVDNVTEDFYNTILAESVTYNRVSGFFSSKALSMYATGLDKLAKNGGKIRFVISKNISEEDFNSIQNGYELRDGDDLSDTDKIHLGNLAYLIAEGKADVKFGLVNGGLFHAKWGYFEDANNDSIYFNGSNNETLQAVQYNFESFNVDLSWDPSPFVNSRIATAKKEFTQLWGDTYPGVKVVDATSLVYEMLSEYDKGELQSDQQTIENALILDFADEGGLHFVDSTEIQIASLKTFKRKFEFYTDERGLPFLRADLSYREVEDIADKAQTQSKRKDVPFVISARLQNWLNSERYSIEEYRKAGLTIKDDDSRWADEELKFAEVVNSEVVRPLKDMQMKSAFYMFTQKRAANFSVPGSGKTAMLLGVFAYLNRHTNPVIDRILVVSPINAFMSWRDEFTAVFGNKKALRYMSVHDDDVANNPLAFQAKWVDSNLVMVNYESLPKMKDAIIESLKIGSGRTMIVFDEVHRIKGIDTVRAAAALAIGPYADYRYVLTGTPIPNGYIDVWNFLHILYQNEYDKFFGFEQRLLKNPDEQDVSEINELLQPFFWRTNKDDLGVPAANEDVIYKVLASEEQLRLAKTVYTTEDSSLAAMIRMMQLSTNPELLSKKISFGDLGISGPENDQDFDDDDFQKQAKNHLGKEIDNLIIDKVKDIDLSAVNAPKFDKGISLVVDLVKKYGKVVVWGLFVDTLDKINNVLNDLGINSEVVYGATQRDRRDTIINTFKEDNDKIQVLVSNPNTLGESVSLHNVVHDAVYFEYNFNLTFMLQSRDRIHRLGLKPNQQTRYYYLMTVSDEEAFNFIDDKIYASLAEKERRMKDAIDNGVLTPIFSDDEFKEMKEIIDKERG